MAQCLTYHRCDGSAGTSSVVVGGGNGRVLIGGRGGVFHRWRRLGGDNHDVDVDVDDGARIDNHDIRATVRLHGDAG